MKIAVVGLGYVGMSMAVLLAARHEVWALDLVQARVDLVNAGRSPIEDAEISAQLAKGNLTLRATTEAAEALTGADFVVIATPTSYDTRTNRFDTASVEAVAETALRLAPAAHIVIKSTIPVGFTDGLRARLGTRSAFLLARVPARGPRALRQPASLAHRGRRPRPCRAALCRSLARSRA